MKSRPLAEGEKLVLNGLYQEMGLPSGQSDKESEITMINPDLYPKGTRLLLLTKAGENLVGCVDSWDMGTHSLYIEGDPRRGLPNWTRKSRFDTRKIVLLAILGSDGMKIIPPDDQRDETPFIHPNPEDHPVGSKVKVRVWSFMGPRDTEMTVLEWKNGDIVTLELPFGPPRPSTIYANFIEVVP